jgi:MFS family permease
MGVMIGPIMGPTLGGYLTEWFHWRWVLYVNVPLGIAATAGLLLTSSPEASLRGIAVPVGTTLVVVGTLASLAAGPLAVAGATLTQRPSDSEDEDEMPALRDGGLQARAPAMGSAATAAMRF